MQSTEMNELMSLENRDSSEVDVESSRRQKPLDPGLYVCPTPIGNLEDITLRVLRVLRESDAIAAEDTRHTLKLLNHYGIKKTLISYHEHNIRTRGPEIVARIVGGEKIALVSDAGMPGISDPGADVIALCREAGVYVTVLPGPTASVTALVASGLRTDRFLFEGFIDRKGQTRKARLEQLALLDGSVILYESPHRLLKTLEDLSGVLGDAPLVIARELTKRYEDVQKKNLSEWVEYYAHTTPKGELVLIFEGHAQAEIAVELTDDRMFGLIKDGLPLKEISKVLAT